MLLQPLYAKKIHAKQRKNLLNEPIKSENSLPWNDGETLCAPTSVRGNIKRGNSKREIQAFPNFCIITEGQRVSVRGANAIY